MDDILGSGPGAELCGSQSRGFPAEAGQISLAFTCGTLLCSSFLKSKAFPPGEKREAHETPDETYTSQKLRLTRVTVAGGRDSVAKQAVKEAPRIQLSPCHSR